MNVDYVEGVKIVKNLQTASKGRESSVCCPLVQAYIHNSA
jgi:hypothetical protein